MKRDREPRKQLLEKQLLEQRLRNIPKPPTPAGLAQKLMVSIPSTIGEAPQAKRLRLRWSLVSAAAAILLAVCLFTYSSRGTPPTTSPPGRSIETIRMTIAREAAAARLLSSAEILLKQMNSRQEAIQKAQEERPELIILDHSLTDNGEIVKTLRSMNETSNSQIIVLTEALKADLATILETGATDEQSYAKETSG